jgi:predicted esterase
VTRQRERADGTAIEFRSLVVPRHARVGVVGDLETASEAWLILHGYGMLAQGILHGFRKAERPGRVLIAPEGLSRFYLEEKGVRRVGASWMTREDREHELEDLLGYLDRVSTGLIDPAARVQVHGFSQGVAAAARWTVRRSRSVARLVCWAGGFPEDVTAELLRPALGAEPLHLVVGDRDVWVTPDQVTADAERLQAMGVPVALHRFIGGHRVDDGVLATLERGSGSA